VEAFYKWTFQFFAKFRNPSLFSYFNELKVSENFKYEELAGIQLSKFQELILFLSKHNDFYSKHIEIEQIDINNITLDDLVKFPIMTKEQLITNKTKLVTRYSFKKVFNCETSGTSGQVLSFPRNEEWDSFNRASIMRGYSWFDVNMWEYNFYFWGYNFNSTKRLKLRFLDFLLNRFRIFDYNTKTLEKVKNKIENVVFIEGYSSMIYELAKLAPKGGYNCSKLKMVKGTSEKIFPHYQEEIRKAFGQTMISEYGAAETGIIAYECQFGKMHINMEGVIVELDDYNEIIVTNLNSKSFPIIRYKLGDTIILDENGLDCPCGKKHPVIKEISGRVGKNIIGKTKKFPSLTLYYVFKNIYFSHNISINYQGHQNDIGKVDLWFDRVLTKKEISMVQIELNKYFADEIFFTLKFQMDFRIGGGKLRDFITSINNS
jgi:phenylacetate-CoA ligase